MIGPSVNSPKIFTPSNLGTEHLAPTKLKNSSPTKKKATLTNYLFTHLKIKRLAIVLHLKQMNWFTTATHSTNYNLPATNYQLISASA
jgi:hypothetical protein